MIETPVKMIETAGAWFNKDRRLVFLSALGIGIIANLLTLVYMFTSQDALMYGNVFTAGAQEASIGRWAIAFFTTLRGGRVAMPVTGLAACVFMAAAAMLTVDVFELRTGVFRFLTAAMFGSAPMLTVMLLYDHLADAYVFKILAAAISVLFMVKTRNKIAGAVLSGFFLMISMALYQNMLGYIVAMALMVFAIRLFDKDIPVKESLKTLLHYVICVAAGGVMYIIGSVIALKCWNTKMTTYNGAISTSPLDFVLNMPRGVARAYKACLSYFLGNTIIYNSSWRRPWIFAAFFACVAIAVVTGIITAKLYREKSRVILLLASVILLPLALNIIFVLTSGNDPYVVNTEQMIILVPFAFKLLEITDPLVLTKRSFIFAARGVCVLAATVLMFIAATTYIGADIYSELYMKQTWDQTLLMADRMLDRAETTEGYEAGMPILINGMVCDKYWQRDNTYEPYTLGNIVTNQISHYNLIMTTFSWSNIYRLRYGVNLALVTDQAQYDAVTATPEFKEMGVFPAADSVQIIDGVMVVKLMEETYE